MIALTKRQLAAQRQVAHNQQAQMAQSAAQHRDWSTGQVYPNRPDW